MKEMESAASKLISPILSADAADPMQKIVIEVPLHCEKCRSKVMSIAAVAEGVTSAAFERKEKDQVVIIGEGVDVATVTKRLRRKLRYASLVSVDKVENT
ncbi:hypothetical protein L6164_031028 [Bauhinia variegata]|uniref:Uncharacterized protein n=1 Tax=Bauhinia variegata TaxID=167791 RepID=A0ACB9LDT2_BAUVA|nr:hypothetical protein L6164_031028 [Bauhinia variegata]